MTRVGLVSTAERLAAVRRQVVGLHVLTDAREGRDVLGVVEAAAAHAAVVQVRVKGCADRVLYETAARVARICRDRGATCIVDDRIDIALAVGADGTHLGAEDLPVEVARAVAGPDHLLGGTARSAAAARELVAAGADYVGVGPTYPTRTKSGLPDALGPDGVAAVASAVDVPVIAIGGITADRVRQLVEVGVEAVAVVTAVSDAPDPGAAARRLAEVLR